MKIALELGGKSPFMILPDADLKCAVHNAVFSVMTDSGQTCGAGSRTLIPASRTDEIIAASQAMVEAMPFGYPQSGPPLGPVVSARQWASIQDHVKKGIEEGATILTGGAGRPEGLVRSRGRRCPVDHPGAVGLDGGYRAARPRPSHGTF
jgi:aldehyde dehydrogenase (NAD+)